MKYLVSFYFEGDFTKVAVLGKQKDVYKLIKIASFASVDTMQAPGSDIALAGDFLTDSDVKLGDSTDSFSLDSFNQQSEAVSISTPDINMTSMFLDGIEFSKTSVVPCVTEPVLYFHIIDADAANNDYPIPKTTSLAKVEDIKLADNIHHLILSHNSDYSYIDFLNSLAKLKNRKTFKIPAIKCAETSLAYYVSKVKNFQIDEYSLILYIGNDYSKVIFTLGDKLFHIGNSLQIGKDNVTSYDVYFSKILLAMENGNIPHLNNIVVCGEDTSEQLVSSFYDAFPNTIISRLDFEEMDHSEVPYELIGQLSKFVIPIASAIDCFDEESKLHKGINLIPKFILEQQKSFQLAWHGLLLIIFVFLMSFLVTFTFLNNKIKIKDIESEIGMQKLILEQNKIIQNEIDTYQSKISGFDKTQSILDSAAKNSDVWANTLLLNSDFVAGNRKFWFTNIVAKGDKIDYTGFSLNRTVLTKFVNTHEASTLESVNYEKIRDKDVFKFIIHAELPKIKK